MLEVGTVVENKLKFSKQDVHKAELARALQYIAEHISTKKQLLNMAQKNQLKNRPITRRDARLMKEILGPGVPGLKGKTARKQNNGVQLDMVPVPKYIQDHYQEIILAINIMHVNQIPFLITTFRHIHYRNSMNRDIIV